MGTFASETCCVLQLSDVECYSCLEFPVITLLMYDHTLAAVLVLLAVYTKFWKKYSKIEFSSTPSKYLRYSLEDVESMVAADLFEGHLVTLQKVKIKKGTAF